jgi:hypothetical protein
VGAEHEAPEVLDERQPPGVEVEQGTVPAERRQHQGVEAAGGARERGNAPHVAEQRSPALVERRGRMPVGEDDARG